jgi:penicillin-binding protein 1C
MYYKGIIDSTTAFLAKKEPLPKGVESLPQYVPHLLTTLINSNEKESVRVVGINKAWQISASRIVEQYHRRFSGQHVNNIAVLMAEINSGKVRVYIGNTGDSTNSFNNEVDVIRAPRSTGSVMKPLLYAAMIQDGVLLPEMLIPDVPTHINGFSPQNYNKTYEGAVPASRAMARSLNVPAVRMLQTYRYEKFLDLLMNLGISTMTEPADHYGLSIILGGAEASLWELTSVYASLARTLNHYFKYSEPARYNPDDIHSLRINENEPERDLRTVTQSLLSAASIWYMVEAMSKVYRPEVDQSWQLYQSGRKIAWKTGTSYGNRDAWSIGFNRDYIVGVWVGNADGEGRPGLTGLSTAAPVMFDLFNLLPSREWFNRPGGEMSRISVCAKSGYRASVNCEKKEELEVGKSGINAPLCHFCKLIHLDSMEEFRVNSQCEKQSAIRVRRWFILPPVQEWFYRKNHSDYRILPPVRQDCDVNPSGIPMMDMIYPEYGTRIYIPKELSGRSGQTVFELAHRNPASKVFWHLDSLYLGYTRNIHQMGLNPTAGQHKVTVVDEKGEKLSVWFTVISN